MKHTYHITGMTCESCKAKIQSLLSIVKEFKKAAVDRSKGEATVEMEKHIDTSELQLVLKDYPKYQLTEAVKSKSAILQEEKPS